jgi:hypothetical protein
MLETITLIIGKKEKWLRNIGMNLNVKTAFTVECIVDYQKKVKRNSIAFRQLLQTLFSPCDLFFPVV